MIIPVNEKATCQTLPLNTHHQPHTVQAEALGKGQCCSCAKRLKEKMRKGNAACRGAYDAVVRTNFGWELRGHVGTLRNGLSYVGCGVI